MKNLVLGTLTLALVLPFHGRGDTISFDTSDSTGWTVTGGGAVNATPFVVEGFGNSSGPVISLTSDGANGGTFVTGGSLANFDGFWKATYTFFLPADAVNVQFNFSKFFGDDRAVMLLNGNLVSSTGIPSGRELQWVNGVRRWQSCSTLYIQVSLRLRLWNSGNRFCAGWDQQDRDSCQQHWHRSSSAP